MKTAIVSFEKWHHRPAGSIGSSMIRAKWLAEKWLGASIWKNGDDFDVLILQKVYWLDMVKDFKGPKILDMCIVGQTLIMTSDGWKRADTVTIGDKVLTHTGKFRTVKKLYSRTAEVWAYKASRLPEVITTNNHPFRSFFVYGTSGKRKYEDVGWIDGANLQVIKKHSKGNAVVSMPGDDSGQVTIGKDFAWAIGYFCAEGTVGHHQVSFTMHTQEVEQRDRISKYIQSLGSKVCEYTKENTHAVYFSDHAWVQMAREIGAGQNRKLPSFVFSLTNQEKLEILAGYISGDGCSRVEGISVASISQELLFGMWRLARDCGFVGGISYAKRIGHNFTHKDGRVYPALPQWKLSFNPEESEKLIRMVTIYKKNLGWKSPQSKNNEVIHYQEHLLHPLRSTKNVGTAQVYNFEVETDNSYVANGYVVHNCDPDWMRSEETNGKIVEISQHIDAITTSTDELRDVIKKIVKIPVVTVPDRINLDYFTIQKKHTERAKSVVWFGYYHKAKEVLNQAMLSLKKRNLSLYVVSNAQFFPDNDYGVEISNIQWEPNNAFMDIQSGDFVINPPSPFGDLRFKSNNKTIISWALGMPVVNNADDMDRFLDPVERTKEATLRRAEVERDWTIDLSVRQYQYLIEEIQKKKGVNQ